MPQSAAGTVHTFVCLCMCICVFLLLTVTLNPPQLDLRSGKTSTLLDVVDRPQAGGLHTDFYLKHTIMVPRGSTLLIFVSSDFSSMRLTFVVMSKMSTIGWIVLK